MKYITAWQLIKTLLKCGLSRLSYKIKFVDKKGNASNILQNQKIISDDIVKETYIWTAREFWESTQIPESKLYIHKKTGNPYSLVTNNFMFKENGEWRRGLCLYKTEYENPDGEFFARTQEDFYNNFEEVK